MIDNTNIAPIGISYRVLMLTSVIDNKLRVRGPDRSINTTILDITTNT